MREYHVRICEGLGVKFPGPTRQFRTDVSPKWSREALPIHMHGKKAALCGSGNFQASTGPLKLHRIFWGRNPVHIDGVIWAFQDA